MAKMDRRWHRFFNVKDQLQFYYNLYNLLLMLNEIIWLVVKSWKNLDVSFDA